MLTKIRYPARLLARFTAPEIPDVGTEWARHLLGTSHTPESGIKNEDYEWHVRNITETRAFSPEHKKAAAYAIMMHTLEIIGGVKEARTMHPEEFVEILRGKGGYRPDVINSAKIIIDRAIRVRRNFRNVTSDVKKAQVLKDILANNKEFQGDEKARELLEMPPDDILIAYAIAGGHSDHLTNVHKLADRNCDYESQNAEYRRVVEAAGKHAYLDEAARSAVHIHDKLRVAAHIQIHRHYHEALSHYAQERML